MITLGHACGVICIYNFIVVTVGYTSSEDGGGEVLPYSLGGGVLLGSRKFYHLLVLE